MDPELQYALSKIEELSAQIRSIPPEPAKMNLDFVLAEIRRLREQVDHLLQQEPLTPQPSAILWPENHIPDSDQTTSMETVSLDTDEVYGDWRLYDFPSPTPVGLFPNDDEHSNFGSGSYLMLVRDGSVSPPILKYATLTAGELETQDVYVGVTANDTTPGWLNDQLIAGTHITLTVNPAGIGDQQITIACDGIPEAHTHPPSDLSGGSEGEIIVVISGTPQWTSGTTYVQNIGDGRYWITGDDETSCHGSAIGDTDGTQVIDLEGRSLVDSGWDVSATTESTSTGTGAFVVGGGLGVAGNIYGGGVVSGATSLYVGDGSANGWTASSLLATTSGSIILQASGDVGVGMGTPGSVTAPNVWIGATTLIDLRPNVGGSLNFVCDKIGYGTAGLQGRSVGNWMEQGGFIATDATAKSIKVIDAGSGAEITIEVLAR